MGKLECSGYCLPNGEIFVDVSRPANLFCFPSGFIDGEGSTITEVGKVGEGGSLYSGGLSLALNGEVVSHFYVPPVS